MTTKKGASANINLASLNLFQGEAHRPFHLKGGRPAAVLVHGFLGSPAELRPLANHLHQAGWTVYGVLLPGFGADIPTLFDRRRSDWTNAVRTIVADLTVAGRPILLLGYSMGAAIAMSVAAEMYVDSLVLLAPFWRIGAPGQRLIWQGLKRLFPSFQPFRRADFSDPRLKAFFEKTMPMLDMTDSAVQQAIRRLEVPSRFVDEIAAVGDAAISAAETLQQPTLIIQGTDDEAVTPKSTRQLITRFNAPVSYHELIADHGLVEIDNPGFVPMARIVYQYAAQLLEKEAVIVKGS